MEHSMNVRVATDFNLDVAHFIHHLKFWTLRNLANKKHLHDGHCWTYNSLEAFQDLFPYWTKRQLERVIKTCVDGGLVVKGNYNQTPYDRTCWYALTEKAFLYYPELQEEKYLKLLNFNISPKREIKFTKARNQVHQKVTPIPDSKPDTKPYTTTDEPSGFFTKEVEEEILKQKIEGDPITDSEFIEAAKHHIEHNSDKKYTKYQRIQGLLKLLRKHKKAGIYFVQPPTPTPTYKTYKQYKENKIHHGQPYLTKEQWQLINGVL